MAIKPKLRGFISDQCANMVNGFCVHFDRDCIVLTDLKPCQYLEKSVLGPPNYKFRVPGYDYQKLFDEYSKVNLSFARRRAAPRKCECGEVLLPRYRYCEKCQKRRASTAGRERRRKFYQKHRSNVTV